MSAPWRTRTNRGTSPPRSLFCPRKVVSKVRVKLDLKLLDSADSFACEGSRQCAGETPRSLCRRHLHKSSADATRRPVRQTPSVDIRPSREELEAARGGEYDRSSPNGSSLAAETSTIQEQSSRDPAPLRSLRCQRRQLRRPSTRRCPPPRHAQPFQASAENQAEDPRSRGQA